MWEKLMKLSPLVIYLLLIVAVVVPLLFPMGLPLSVNENAQTVFDLVDGLQPGDYIFISNDFDPGAQTELKPQLIALLQHAFKKNLKVIGYAQWDLGAPLFQGVITEVAKEYGKQEGVDWVNIGYKPAQAVTIRSMLNDWSVASTDFNNKKLVDYPLIQAIKNLKDVEVIAVLSAGDPGFAAYVQNIGTPSATNPGKDNPEGFMHRIYITGGATSVSVPDFLPDVRADIITGFLEGGRGAAEYETLLGTAGGGLAMMDAQSIAHLLIIALIVLGNIGYFATRKSS
jgi:hypothetical protein